MAEKKYYTFSNWQQVVAAHASGESIESSAKAGKSMGPDRQGEPQSGMFFDFRLLNALNAEQPPQPQPTQPAQRKRGAA